MRRILAVAQKELRQVLRDRTTFVLLVVMPAVMLILFGFALTLDIEHVPLAVLDEDRTEASRDLAAAFYRTGAFDLVARPADRRELVRLLDHGEVSAALAIPPGYARALAEGRQAAVQLLVDGADSNSARVAIGYAQAIARDQATVALVQALPQELGGFAPRIEARSRVLYNPELRSAPFIVPGLLGIVLLIATTLMTGMSIARERELGTFEALIATPIGRLELILGKTLPFVVVAALDVVLALAATRLAFGVEVRGSLFALTVATLLFVVGALGYGLLISTLASTQQVAFQIGLMTTLLPSFLLSGFIFPIENMVRPVQWVTAIVPARYYIAAMRAIVLKGSSLAETSGDVAALAAFAVALPVLAALRFRKRVG